MDSNPRLIAKAISWQMLGLLVMTLIGYVVTGSVTAGGAIAFAGAMAGVVTYILHEKLWARIDWGRTEVRPGRSPRPSRQGRVETGHPGISPRTR